MASKCDCGSYAINPTMHGRSPGIDLDKCDVCYWRSKLAALEKHREELAETLKAALIAIDAAMKTPRVLYAMPSNVATGMLIAQAAIEYKLAIISRASPSQAKDGGAG